MQHWNLLPHLTGIRLEGPDAQAFAHSQFTTAFNQEYTPGWGLTAWCNPKGRVISVMLARTHDTAVELIAPECLGEVIKKRLPMYAIGRKVSIIHGLSVAGRLNEPSEPASQIRIDGDRELTLDAADPGLDDESVSDWKTRDVCAGIVWLSATQSEQHIPQALGLAEREGLSFTKGCYPGQEIVARVHYLGRAKQRLEGFRIAGISVAPGEELLDNEGRAAIGSVVSVASSTDDLIGLTVVGIDVAADQGVRLGNHSGRLCHPGDLC
jgi:folate-binding protein YgfZ